MYMNKSWSFDWNGLAGAAIVAVVIVTVGPITLICAWLIQAWCVHSVLDARDRWDSVRIFSVLFALLTALTILAFFLMPGPTSQIWLASPLQRMLGTPDLLANLKLRWIGSLPLSFALAFLLEWGRPLTIQRFVRILTADEKAQLAARRQQAVRERAEAQARGERERAEEMARAERAAARRAAARRRAASAMADAPAQATHETAKPNERKPTLWEQAITPPAAPPVPPPAPKKQQPEKPDLGDGSMDALL
jgi:hypothetical protein